MLSVLDAIVLGIVQGFTEFLPVSSSGHLVLTQQLLGIDTSNLTFGVVVHVGTLLAVLVALWEDIRVLLDGLRLTRDRRARQGRHLILLLVVGTLPAVVVGLAFKDTIEALFSSVYMTGLMLLATGSILLLAERRRAGRRQMESMQFSDALVVGCGQALAILPGLSRSGTTISVGFMRGLARDDAARFSFLLSIPAILGAAVLELPEALAASNPIPTSVILAGLISAAVTGYFAITLLVRFVRHGSLKGFAYYTWVVGIMSLAFAYLRG